MCMCIYIYSCIGIFTKDHNFGEKLVFAAQFCALHLQELNTGSGRVQELLDDN